MLTDNYLTSELHCFLAADAYTHLKVSLLPSFAQNLCHALLQHRVRLPRAPAPAPVPFLKRHSCMQHLDQPLLTAAEGSSRASRRHESRLWSSQPLGRAWATAASTLQSNSPRCRHAALLWAGSVSAQYAHTDMHTP